MPVMPSFWQRIQSYFYPVTIRKSSSPVNPVLELFYYHGRYILGTKEAVYSDGLKYRPMLTAFHSSQLKPHLPKVRNVLVLGTGLASAVHILHSYGYHPTYTLVELDHMVLDWAVEYLPPETVKSIYTVCANAFDFIAGDKESYDLIIVDVFNGRKVPTQVTTSGFLNQCRARLSTGGFLVLNYMVNSSDDETRAEVALEAVFDTVERMSFGINQVYVATA
jgi:spermidine synthase